MGEDLEARLRTHAAATAWNPFGELCTEAAEEIRKLRFALECREVEIAQLSARRSAAEVERAGQSLLTEAARTAREYRAEIDRLRAERDALRRTVEGYNGLGHWRCRQAVELHCPDCLSPAPHHSSGCRILAALATSSPSASGPS